MASLNINSLLAHIDEMRVFMSNSKIDLLSINETKLHLTIDDTELYLPGFELISVRTGHVKRLGNTRTNFRNTTSLM